VGPVLLVYTSEKGRLGPPPKPTLKRLKLYWADASTVIINEMKKNRSVLSTVVLLKYKNIKKSKLNFILASSKGYCELI
jgi:hypothetical protein